MKLLTARFGLCVFSPILNTAALARAPVPPTAEHKILASEEGTWDATVKSFEGGPGAEPAVSKGTEVNTLLPGGLWLVSKFEGEFGGVKFEGADSSATIRTRKNTSARGSTRWSPRCQCWKESTTPRPRR